MTGTTTSNASEGLTTCANLVVTLKAPKAPSSSPTLEGETALEAFLPKRRRWLADGAPAPTHLHPVFLVSNSRETTAGLHRRLLNMAHISGVVDRAGNINFGGGQRRLRSQLFIIVILVGAQRRIPKRARSTQRCLRRKGHLGNRRQRQGPKLLGGRRQRQGAEPLNHHSGVAQQTLGRVRTCRTRHPTLAEATSMTHLTAKRWV